jgi:tetratricopeptide (TPR) repeat protein
MYSSMCNFSKALEYNDIAIAIATNYYGKDNLGVMPFLLDKGKLYADLCKIDDAHKLYDKVKNAYISHFGDSCKEMSSVLISEARLLMMEGYVEQALEILKSVETQMISVYGVSSPQLCDVYNSLAQASMEIMQFGEAKKYYQKSLDIVKNNLGEYNVNCIIPLVGLGNVYMSEDVAGQQIEEATRLFFKASNIATSVFGSRNANTASIDALLGQISLRKGNLQDAYNKFQKYNASVMQTVGESTHRHVANGHMNMGHYYIAKANEASSRQDPVNTHSYALLAMEEYMKAKEIIEEIYGNDYAGVAGIYSAIAQAHYTLQQPDLAITTYIKAAELAIKQYGNQSPLVANAYAILGAAYKYASDQCYRRDEKK